MHVTNGNFQHFLQLSQVESKKLGFNDFFSYDVMQRGSLQKDESQIFDDLVGTMTFEERKKYELRRKNELTKRMEDELKGDRVLEELKEMSRRDKDQNCWLQSDWSLDDEDVFIK